MGRLKPIKVVEEPDIYNKIRHTQLGYAREPRKMTAQQIIAEPNDDYAYNSIFHAEIKER